MGDLRRGLNSLNSDTGLEIYSIISLALLIFPVEGVGQGAATLQSWPEMEFKEFEPRFKSAKPRFKLSAGLNLETFGIVLSGTNHI